MKRQRGRGRKPGGGGGGNHGNRPLESNGPDVKIRGTAAQIYEKYSQYARDAQSAGDRVRYENLLQHAEHYFRIMMATMPRDRLFQPQGEGGLAVQTQGQPGAEGLGQPQPAEGGAPGDVAADPMKVVDDHASEDDNEDEREDDSERDSELEAGNEDSEQGDRQPRRRRRGRRRPPEGDRNQQNAPSEEPRSALDSLARRQGAIAGS